MLIQESGGNPGLTSVAGADGYFQVMPATFRELRVDTNVEAGIKYLSQMIRQFGREDYAVAAYNGGPGRARGGRPPLETLQYLLSVGAYRNVLKVHEPSVRRHAASIELEAVQEGDDWWSLSQRTGASILELRMHNPFLATRALRTGQFMAYPQEPRTGLLVRSGDDHVEYRTRLGDNYIHLGFVLDVDRDEMRELNDLWHLQTLPPGQVLRLPLAWEGDHEEHVVEEGDDLDTVADRLESTPWRIVRDNGLFRDQGLTPGTILRVRPEQPRAPPATAAVTHRVVRGDTLIGIAQRYGTTVRAIQEANSMGRRTRIRAGPAAPDSSPQLGVDGNGVARERRGTLGGQRLQACSRVARQNLDHRNPARAVLSGSFRSLVGVDRHQRLASDQHRHGDAGAIRRQRHEGRRPVLPAVPAVLPGLPGNGHAPSLAQRPSDDAGLYRRQVTLLLAGGRLQSDEAPWPQPLVRRHEQHRPARFGSRQIGERVQNPAQRGLFVQAADRIQQPRRHTQGGLLPRHRLGRRDRLGPFRQRLLALAGQRGFVLGFGLRPHLVGARGQLLRQDSGSPTQPRPAGAGRPPAPRRQRWALRPSLLRIIMVGMLADGGDTASTGVMEPRDACRAPSTR